MGRSDSASRPPRPARCCYTPPGYESGEGKFPVFYLLHGVFDCDDAWTSVGRAGFILDNLIAGKKVRPMVVVMPGGHTWINRRNYLYEFAPLLFQ